QALDRLRDGLEVRQHAAEPAMIDIILTAAFGGLCNRLLRLTLGSDEKHAPARRCDITDRLERPRELRDGLFQIDDVDTVANPEDVRLHLRIPAPGVMAEMDARFQKLTHRKIGNRHENSFSG